MRSPVVMAPKDAMPPTKTKRQQQANKRMSGHLPPLSTIIEETQIDAELISAIDRLPIVDKKTT